MARITGYTYIASFRESVIEKVLEKAKAAGVVTQYDTGRGELVWFNGRPGRALREVRNRVLALLGGRKNVRVEQELPACQHTDCLTDCTPRKASR